MTGKSTTPSSYFHRLKGLSIAFVYHTFYKTIQDYSIVYTQSFIINMLQGEVLNQIINTVITLTVMRFNGVPINQ